MRTSFVLLACIVACQNVEGGAPRSEDGESVAINAPAEAAHERWLPLAAAGWIDHEDSPITPWCGVVLVAPDVVVTAARCLGGYDRRDFTIGFGDVSAKHREIEEVVLQRDAINPDYALAALRLTAPVQGIDPAPLELHRNGVCDVASVAYRFVARGDASARWLWSGCLELGTVTTEDGEPNCHGDMGAGAFLANGALVGVATDIWAEGGCAKGHRLATVAENEAFFDAALDLSRPPV